MERSLNHFAISAVLGTQIGPVVGRSRGQLGSLAVHGASANWRADWDELRQLLHRGEDQTRRYLRAVVAAFSEAREGFSPDRVVADPRLNEQFVRACRRRHLGNDVYRLNLTLFMLRKSSQLRGLRTTARTHVQDQWRLAPASEFASRLVYHKYLASVDTVLCHPKLRAEFDRAAHGLLDGHQAFEYRWTALNIRKQGGGTVKQPIDLAEFTDSQRVPFAAGSSRIPEDEGVFAFQERERTLYVASTESLRESFECQQRFLQSGVIPSGLWKPQVKDLGWRFLALPGSEAGARARLANSLIGTLNPLFNIPRAA